MPPLDPHALAWSAVSLHAALGCVLSLRYSAPVRASAYAALASCLALLQASFLPDASPVPLAAAAAFLAGPGLLGGLAFLLLPAAPAEG